MYNKFKLIWSNKWILRSLVSSIFFNFYYLPLKQAIKLPILLYKPRFALLKGTITILGRVKTGMIILGRQTVGLYQNNGIYFQNEGNIFFNGHAEIGNDSYIGVGPGSTVVFGKNFSATTTFRLTSFVGITFGDYTRIGWDCIAMDSDFHRLTRLDGTMTKGYGKIKIGNNNWIGNGCRIMKNTCTPDFCTISAGTWLNGIVKAPPYSIVGAKREYTVLKTDIYLDPNNHMITDYNDE